MLGHDFAAVIAERTRRVEIATVTRPDESTVTTQQRGVFNESVFQRFVKRSWNVREPFANRFDI
jgi:hypothetical protein